LQANTRRVAEKT